MTSPIAERKMPTLKAYNGAHMSRKLSSRHATALCFSEIKITIVERIYGLYYAFCITVRVTTLFSEGIKMAIF